MNNGPFGRTLFSREAHRRSQKLFPYVKMVENREDIPIHVNNPATVF